ncbi:MAG: flagellar motor switch protein FliN [Piscirickettsiaceae bacterium]|nr:flagellar motor switch protein FliN [Piscirickettsiaceae bacterium]
MSEEETQTDQETTDEWADALEEQGAGAKTEEDPWDAALEEQAESESTQAAPATQLSDDSRPSNNTEMNLDMVLDLPVTISMEIGRTKMNIRNLLQLSQGSVVELDRLAGEPMDVLVNDTLIAHGEVVVVNDKFGIRLTDVISADERIKKLR